MPRIASLSPHELRGCTLRVPLAALLRLRLKSRQFWADSGRSYEGCRKSEKLGDEGPLNIQRPFLFLGTSPPAVPLNAQFPAAPINRIPHIPWWWSTGHQSVSKGTDAPLPKLLDSFCVGFFSPGTSALPATCIRLIVPLGKEGKRRYDSHPARRGYSASRLHFIRAVPEQHRVLAGRDELHFCICC